MNIPEYLHFDNHALSGVLHVNILNGYYWCKLCLYLGSDTECWVLKNEAFSMYRYPKISEL